MPQTLKAIAEFTASRLIGKPDTEISKLASLGQAQTGALVFVQDQKDLARALASAASAVLAGEFASTAEATKPILIAQNPRFAFARAGELVHPHKAYMPGVHATAVVDPSAKIAPTTAVDAYAVVEANAVIGER